MSGCAPPDLQKSRRNLNGREEAMPNKNATGALQRSRREPQTGESTALERKRQYKREFMRKWRASPQHRLRESFLRSQWNYERKKRQAAELDSHMNGRGEPKCGICGKLPPVTEVVRLRVSECAPGGYVEVRIPYCGTC
jgi:hypothetical protein